MITALEYKYTPIILDHSKKISRALLRSDAPKLSLLKNDVFIKTKLSVPQCAESFFIRPLFANAIKNLTKKDIYKLQPVLDTERKTVSIAKQPVLTKFLNNFMKKVPEVYYIFRPKTNEPDLAQHVISTLRKILQHTKYKKLSQREQNILHVCALSHDIGKALVSTPEHAEASAKIMAKRLDKINMPEEDKKLIVKLIEHHHYCYHITSKNKTYNDYAKIFTEKEFKLLKILTEADVSSKKLLFKNILRMIENKFIFRAQQKEYAKLNKNKALTLNYN